MNHTQMHHPDAQELRALFNHRSARSYGRDLRRIQRGEERITTGTVIRPVYSPQPLTQKLFQSK